MDFDRLHRRPRAHREHVRDRTIGLESRPRQRDLGPAGDGARRRRDACDRRSIAELIARADRRSAKPCDHGHIGIAGGIRSGRAGGRDLGRRHDGEARSEFRAEVNGARPEKARARDRQPGPAGHRTLIRGHRAHRGRGRFRGKRTVGGSDTGRAVIPGPRSAQIRAIATAVGSRGYVEQRGGALVERGRAQGPGGAARQSLDRGDYRRRRARSAHVIPGSVVVDRKFPGHGRDIVGHAMRASGIALKPGLRLVEAAATAGACPGALRPAARVVRGAQRRSTHRDDVRRGRWIGRRVGFEWGFMIVVAPVSARRRDGDARMSKVRVE